MYGASTAPPLLGRPARERRAESARSPVDGFSRIILIPLQKEPKSSHHCPSGVTTRFGSIAFQVPLALSITRPRLVHEPAAAVGLVARKIAERWEPKVLAE